MLPPRLPLPLGAQQSRCAVLGAPIAHSLSPVLHQAAYRQLGLDWSYEAIEVTEEQLPAFLASRDAHWRGLSLTMPLKRSVMVELDECDTWAQRAQAANTVVFAGNTRFGANTDIPGAIAALRERYDGAIDSAVIWGGGATAAAVMLALAKLGATRMQVAARTPSRAAATLKVVQAAFPQLQLALTRLDEPLAAADVVASTIPASAQSSSLLEGAAEANAVFDVIYDPWPTPLAQQALSSGQALISGLDLLAHQAVGQVELMTQQRVELAVLRNAGERELARRSRTSSREAPNAS